MGKRFVSIWFPHLSTDWFALRQPRLKTVPFVLRTSSHGRMVITAANSLAQSQGVFCGMVLADARALIPSLEVLDDKPDLIEKLLHRLAEWCIRFSPYVVVDAPDGLLLDVTGCAYLWGGDHQYLITMTNRLRDRGYTVRLAMADTIGACHAVARFGSRSFIIETGKQADAILALPPESLRIEQDVIERLYKLGLRQIKDFISMPRATLRRRFGIRIIQRLNQALGHEEEIIQPVLPVEPYQERLPCLEPIVSASGIEIALQRLLEALCGRLQKEGKGLRQAVFTCYRVDGNIQKLEIGTNRASHHVSHIFKLFEIKLSAIEPDLGIELFTLEAPKVEDVNVLQEKLWDKIGGLDDIGLAELLDRLSGKIGPGCIHRYLPDEHYWPERSIKVATSLEEKTGTEWRVDKARPVNILSRPERIEVTAPIPDYPPMLFRYKGKLHKIIKADGPERIEQEWWLQQGQHRDYYSVEDEDGNRYWLFRSGHYDEEKSYQWFIHGFFA